jgi:hypothetical protein
MASPHKSLQKLAQQSGMSYSSWLKAVKKLKMFPFKMHVIHHLFPPDCEKQSHYCKWLMEKEDDDPHMLDWTFNADEAWFHLIGYVDFQKTCLWSQKIPMQHRKLAYTLWRLEWGVQWLDARFLVPSSQTP